MFGYVIPDPTRMNKADYQYYRSYYCGLCQALKEQWPVFGRLTLTYDLTFALLLWDGLANQPHDTVNIRCPLHLLKATPIITSPALDYAAGINLLLSYYKLKDDEHDAGSLKAKIASRSMKGVITPIIQRYPAVSDFISQRLEALNQLEKDNIMDPVRCSHEFGLLLKGIFAEAPLIQDEALCEFAYHLGRFLYLLDAVIDLKKDLKTQNFNALVQSDSSRFSEMLEGVYQAMLVPYQQLNLHKNKEICDNIVYNGLWSRYQLHLLKKGVRYERSV